MDGGATVGLVRNVNRSTILELIREHGPIARSQIAQSLRMSLPSVMRIVDDLVDEDLVRYEGTSGSTGGRPASLVAFNSDAYVVVGVDLGGTKMFGTVANLDGRIQEELYLAHRQGPPGDYLERLCELIDALLDAPRPVGQRVRGIGIGAPGITLTPEGVVTWAPSLQWRDLPLQDIIRTRFDMPVLVENDVNLAALGEWGFGAGQGARNLVSISVGTGIGAGIIIDGALYRGHSQAAGEIGYMVPGIEMLARRYDEFGAFESLASGSGIAERARRRLKQEGSAPATEELSACEVFEAARGGEQWALQVVDETVDYLVLAVANVSAILNPEVIILGGGVSASADMLVEPILQRIEGVVPYVPRIVASPLGRRAAVMGAITMILNATTEYFVIKRLP